jgi:hypothetical protein
VEHPAPAGLLPAAAFDAKVLTGARTESGRDFLLGAVAHASGAVLGRRCGRVPALQRIKLRDQSSSPPTRGCSAFFASVLAWRTVLHADAGVLRGRRSAASSRVSCRRQVSARAVTCTPTDADATGTAGSVSRSALRPWPPLAPATAPISAPATCS